jgi:hypothetical protein
MSLIYRIPSIISHGLELVVIGRRLSWSHSADGPTIAPALRGRIHFIRVESAQAIWLVHDATKGR